MNEDVKMALDSMILSASGWRKIFAEDNDEESWNPAISTVDGWLAYVAGITFARYLSTFTLDKKKIILARDSRPTGGMLISHLIMGMNAEGYECEYLGIATITEVLAYVRESDKYDAFFYVSASHNPVGYNGFKFGLADGAVLGGEASKEVIRMYKDLLATDFSTPQPLDAKPILANSALKLQASQSYRQYIQRSLHALCDDHLAILRKNIEKNQGFGIVVDFNGSARISSIDKSILESMGIRVQVMGEQLGQFHHAIVPEGDSLLPCQRKLEEMHKADPSYQLGIVVDCDGDRGNLVYIDEKGKACAMDAQTTFSLSVLATLVYTWSTTNDSISVVVNDATSLRVEEICEHFGVTCHWSETGEANVLSKANALRKEGMLVPICGEGSNGGTIIYPSTVRDPLTTILSLINLLFMEHRGQRLLAVCQHKLGLSTEHWRLATLVEHMPAYSTTSVVSPEALVKVTSSSYQLKKNYLKLFQEAWGTWQREFQDDNLSHYDVYHYEGMEKSTILQEPADGGMRIHLFDKSGKIVVALWMRGSKTEPIFRLMADSGAPSHQEKQQRWHKIHRQLIIAADQLRVD